MEKKGAFDYILLETTGLADPGNLAPLFWVDDGLGSTIYLDGIVTLVDAKNILRSLDDPSGQVEGHDHDGHGPLMTTAHVQISHADVIVINKSDLVNAEQLEQVKARIQAINGLAKLHVTAQSAVPELEGFLLDLHAYDQVDKLDTAGKGHSHLDPVGQNPNHVIQVLICEKDDFNNCYRCAAIDARTTGEARWLAAVYSVGGPASNCWIGSEHTSRDPSSEGPIETQLR